MEFNFGLYVFCIKFLIVCTVDGRNYVVRDNKRTAYYNKVRALKMSNISPLEVRKDYTEIMQFENYPYRRIYEENDKTQPNVEDKREKSAALQMATEKDGEKFESLFDKNGMMYLTQPAGDEGRQLNALMNEIVKTVAHLRRKQFKRMRYGKEDSITLLYTADDRRNGVDVESPKIILQFSE